MRNLLSNTIRSTLCIAAALAAQCVAAADRGDLSVTVRDSSGDPIPEVAVYAEPVGDAVSPATLSSPATAEIDQFERAFVPHISIVERGSNVQFPNSDKVLHHVYSFSAPKRFEFPLYGSQRIPPNLQFDEAGLITLGCNIHDGMLAYILVVDTPYFAMTDDSGTVELSGLPAGSYRVEIWTARVRPKDLPPSHILSVAGAARSEAHFTIEEKLRPPHAQSETSLRWARY